MKVPHNPSEIIAVVDDNDNIIGKITRGEVHKSKILHREICVFLINSKKQVLLQKRIDRDIWDNSCGGHFPKDQTYIDAAEREFEEELGIKLMRTDFVEIAKEKLISRLFADTINYRFVEIFVVKKDISVDDICFDEGEIGEVKYFDKNEILELINHPKEVITNSAKEFLQKYILKELE